MAKVAFHLHSHPSLSPFLPSLRNQTPIFHFRTISVHNRRFLLLSSRPLHIRNPRQWDSNAEPYEDDNNSNNEDELIDESLDQWAELLQDYIDSIWIFKVFRSFGWTLPPIIISMLIVSGPKAFLMALAVPIGQSTFAFAIQRFLNRGKSKTKPKAKTKTRTRSKRPRNAKFDPAAKQVLKQIEREKKKGYQSWIFENDVSESRDSTASSFGGWDELDYRREPKVVPTRKAARKSTRFQEMPAEKGKNREWSASDGPLLLRLLVSMFPFLSSWTKIP